MAKTAGSYQQTVGEAAIRGLLDRPNRVTVLESEGIDRLKRRLNDHYGGIHATPRESETLALLIIGLSDKQVATSLRISPRTVQMHVRNFCHRNRIHNRVEAAALWTIAHAAVGSPPRVSVAEPIDDR